MKRLLLAVLSLALFAGACSGPPRRRPPEPEEVRNRAREADRDLEREENRR